MMPSPPRMVSVEGIVNGEDRFVDASMHQAKPVVSCRSSTRLPGAVQVRRQAAIAAALMLIAAPCIVPYACPDANIKQAERNSVPSTLSWYIIIEPHCHASLLFRLLRN